MQNSVINHLSSDTLLLSDISVLSQEDLASGWKIHTAKKKYKEVKEINIYLYELPPDLFKFFNDTYLITHKLFKYNIMKTIHDDKILQLYLEINNKIKNIELITELYNYCISNDISGWLIINTKELLNNSKK